MVGADDEGLAHVRDIEQAGVGARVQVLLEDAEGVLDRHLVAGERHHAGAKRDVQIVERGALQGGGIGGSGHVGPRSLRFRNARTLTPPGVRNEPPLSRYLRD